MNETTRVATGHQPTALWVALPLALALVGPPAYAASPMSSAITATNAVTAGRNDAPSTAPTDGLAADEVGPPSDAEVQGYGCLLGGTAATALTWLAGTNQMIMVVAGGTLGPTNTAGVLVAVAGTVFASVCAVGALATPAVMRAWHIFYEGKHVKAN